MRSIRKSKTSLVLILLISFFNTAIASPGNYSVLKEGESAPFDSWCFDADAIAKILADKEMTEQKCQLRIDKEIEILIAKHQLEYGNLQATLNYEVNTKQATIDALKKENLELEEIIVDSSDTRWMVVFTLGSVALAVSAVTLGVVLYDR